VAGAKSAVFAATSNLETAAAASHSGWRSQEDLSAAATATCITQRLIFARVEVLHPDFVFVGDLLLSKPSNQQHGASTRQLILPRPCAGGLVGA
jgi:hypothetical protein